MIDLTQFNEIVASIVADAEKANVKGNKSAAKRIRKATLDLRKAIVAIREQALALYADEDTPAE